MYHYIKVCFQSWKSLKIIFLATAVLFIKHTIVSLKFCSTFSGWKMCDVINRRDDWFS